MANAIIEYPNPSLASNVECGPDNSMVISAPVQFVGPVSNEYKDYLLSGVNTYLSGTYDTGHGTISISASAYEGTGGSTVYFQSVGGNGAEANYLGQNIYLNMAMGTVTDWTLAHELTHNYGGKDTYSQTVTGEVVTQPGLMGTYGDHMIPREAEALYTAYCGPMERAPLDFQLDLSLPAEAVLDYSTLEVGIFWPM